MVKGKHTAGDRQGIGAAICVVFTLCAVIAATNKYGAAFNPAVGLTVTLNQILFIGWEHQLRHYLYAYVFGPALGGVLAGLFHIPHAKLHEVFEKGKYPGKALPETEYFLEKD